MLHDRSMDLLRQKYRHQGASLDEVQDPEHIDFPTLEQEEIRTQLLHQILKIVRTEFSETTWKAFWEHCIQGRSPREIGEELSISPGTVYVAKQRVLTLLRARFGDFLPD
jgi:RNA polymerase sigma-70 factor (ECF subfamily)